MTEKELTASRFLELAGRSYEGGYIVRTDFLTLAEQALLQDIRLGREKDVPERFPEVNVILYGGFPEAERKAAFFMPDYFPEEALPKEELVCLRIRPLQKKFAEELTHRDYLGALMNLGIKRDRIGDILVDRDSREAWVFAAAPISDMIRSELIRVRHTSVEAREEKAENCVVRPAYDCRTGTVASERLDAVLAFVFRLSREKAREMVDREDVAVDGRPAAAPGMTLKAGSRVTARGFGKFIFDGIEKETKKGRMVISVRLFK